MSREHRRAKTDRLDTELLKRAFLGWLRGERRHCSMAAIPTVAEEDARRPNRERENLVSERTRVVNQMKAILARFGIRTFQPTLRKAEEKLEGLRTAEGTPLPENTRAELRRHLARLRVVREQIRAIEQERLRKLAAAPAGDKGPHAMVRLIARVLGVGVETADMLVNEILSRHLRDRRAVARYAGLTGSPDESGRRRRERGLARAGNARVRCGMIQLAWRFLRFQRTALWPNGFMRERPTDAAHAQDDDRGPGAQAAHRPLASRHDGRGAAGRGLTPGVMSDSTEKRDNRQATLAAHASGLPMTIRGGGDPPLNPWLPSRCEEWARRLGALPPMRMTASWFRSSRIDRIQGCGAISRPPDGELPSELSSFCPLQESSPDQRSLPPCSRPSRASRFAMACGHP